MGRSGFTDKGVNHSLGVSHFNQVVKDQKALKSKAKACKVKRAIISIKGHKNGMLGDNKSFYTIGLGYRVVTLILSSSSSSFPPPPSFSSSSFSSPLSSPPPSPPPPPPPDTKPYKTFGKFSVSRATTFS